MATYNKRGYKSPKEKEEKVTNNFAEEVVIIDEKDSTTAGVFSKLDKVHRKPKNGLSAIRNIFLLLLLP